MKTIGLIGGMSWESTIPYYKIINEYVGRELGGLHNARIILYSVEFGELEKYMSAGEWEKIEDVLSKSIYQKWNDLFHLLYIYQNNKY